MSQHSAAEGQQDSLCSISLLAVTSVLHPVNTCTITDIHHFTDFPVGSRRNEICAEIVQVQHAPCSCREAAIVNAWPGNFQPTAANLQTMGRVDHTHGMNRRFLVTATTNLTTSTLLRVRLVAFWSIWVADHCAIGRVPGGHQAGMLCSSPSQNKVSMLCCQPSIRLGPQQQIQACSTMGDPAH